MEVMNYSNTKIIKWKNVLKTVFHVVLWHWAEQNINDRTEISVRVSNVEGMFPYNYQNVMSVKYTFMAWMVSDCLKQIPDYYSEYLPTFVFYMQTHAWFVRYFPQITVAIPRPYSSHTLGLIITATHVPLLPSTHLGPQMQHQGYPHVWHPISVHKLMFYIQLIM